MYLMPVVETSSSPGRLYSGKSSATRKSERRQIFIDAAISVYAEFGYHGATVRKICAQAELTSRYFYESFKDHEELFTACYEQVLQELLSKALAAAQQFYGAENRVTSLTMKIANRRDAPRAVLAINQQLPPEEYEVKSWEELIPELLEARQLDQAGNAFVMGLLYLIIIFGIFGTILMMTKEREYEFGVLTAIGMGRARLFGTVWLETVLLGVLGSVLGILLSIPLVHYLATNPIDMAVFGEEAVETYHKFGIEPVFQGAFEWSIFLRQALIIFIATSLLALYPLIKIIRLRPVEAMRA